MKKRFHIFIFLLLTLNTCAQTKYSESVKRFIDYDTAILVLQHALLIDGTGSMAKPGQTLIIKNGKIDWVGDDAKAVISKQSLLIDLNGKSLLPGFVMLHEHLYIRVAGESFVRQLPVSFPRLYLAAGATTVRTTGSNEPYFDLRIKSSIEAGRTTGPTMFLTAPYINGDDGNMMMHQLNSEEAAIRMVNYWAEEGFSSFKVYRGIEKNILKSAIQAAHKKGKKLTGHLCSITHREAAELGIDHLEHGFMDCTDFVTSKKENVCPSVTEQRKSIADLNLDSDSLNSLIRLLVGKKIGLTSTLAVFEGFSTDQPVPASDVLEMLSLEQKANYLTMLGRITGPSTAAAMNFDKAFKKAAQMEKKFFDAGGLLAVGTDPTGNGGLIAGYGTWRAIELLVETAGFTPLEALKIATLNGARVLGIEKTAGTIEVGKEADLIVIDGDPSKKISDIRKVVCVFKDGVGFNSKRMFESVKGKVGYY